MVTGANFLLSEKRLTAIAVLIFIFSFNILTPQEPSGSFFYRIYFRDKGKKEISDYTPGELVSTRSVERRIRNGIPNIDNKDIPVADEYLNEISRKGLKLHCTSKWMNTALFESDQPNASDSIISLSFVSDVRIVKTAVKSTSLPGKLDLRASNAGNNQAGNHLLQTNGYLLHESGFTGTGVLIAILDAGFAGSESINSLNDIRQRNGIKATYDFIEKKQNVYDHHNHGTAVFSILSGNIPGSLDGSAPGSDYILLRTEDETSEFPSEEDFWVAGAEFADSAGADIINSSLGYFEFDDPSMNYKYSEMDGNSTFISAAADIAASRGILVVSSAGNERTGSWKYLTAPADADSVIAVGAVDRNGVIASFSSSGPTFDRRIKPDVVAQGVTMPFQVKDNVERGSGTSYSCPVITGLCACLMQAVPEATAFEIMTSLRSSSDRYNIPDTLYGYGIPDMSAALQSLQAKYQPSGLENTVTFPNPFRDELTIYFKFNPEWLRVEIISISGTLIYRREYNHYISRWLLLDDIGRIPPGLYFIRLHTSAGKEVHKIIKM
ncbi:MAG: S8 family serine peptidase [Bacteroidales bacterium]|nr:S8 family serine peptidase [Bacteroidales bacterium]